FDEGSINILWIDVHDDSLSGYSDMLSSSYPIKIKDGSYVSSVLWYAFYGENGMPILQEFFEREQREWNTAYMEHDGRFKLPNYKTDFVITAIGVLPDSKLAVQEKLKTGIKGGILVNNQYQTSKEHIYAVGDTIIVRHQVSDNDVLIPLASPANRQGRQLADILSGLNVKNRGTLGTSIVKVFDLSMASTGLNEKQLEGKDYKVIHLSANDHASYYPHATPINLKVIFDPKTEMILGAQAVGQKGIDKRIDVLATAIKGKIKVTDLQELELSYAPPFSSAKDIVNLAGYVSQNILLGLTKTVQWHEVPRLLKEDDTIFVDVRSAFEREANGYIINSIHFDVDTLDQTYKDIPKDKK
ncbi:MAG: hypothetical protein CVV62_02470, partial [Tenericutes bacterium HGW-Tenericutes-7]